MLGLVDEAAELALGGTPWGLGVVAVAAVAGLAATRARPLAKGVVKGYLATRDRASAWRGAAAEQVQGLYAAAKQEHESERGVAAARPHHSSRGNRRPA